MSLVVSSPGTCNAHCLSKIRIVICFTEHLTLHENKEDSAKTRQAQTYPIITHKGDASKIK